jgi:hypothetical protein
VEKAICEMAQLSNQCGSNHFNFSNDVIDPAYLKVLSREMLAGGHRFFWNTDLRAEKAFDAQTCQLMARAGLNSVAIGFESGCQQTLDAMDKGKRVEIIADVLKNLYTSGVATQAMGIFGMPGESEAHGLETVRFLEANADHISYYVMGLLMVLPGSRMHSDPGAHGVSTISYGHNPLKTPEPVWWSDTRMSIESVNRLYARLSCLEQIYAIAEYPYVGGLSTNHSFLYYTLGPDILKRLRRDELDAQTCFHRLIGMDGSSLDVEKFKKHILRTVLPFHLHRSRFDLQRISVDAEKTSGAKSLPLSAESIFFQLPSAFQQPPVRIDSREVALLKRINGRRTLWNVLKKVDSADLKRTLSFLWFLFQAEAIELTWSRGKP